MALRVNVGCGNFPILPDQVPGGPWVNIDEDPACAGDLVLRVPPLPYGDNEVDELYLGQVLEHHDYMDGQALLRECLRVLKPGGKCGVTVPDTRAIVQKYLAGESCVVELPRAQFWDLLDLDAVGHLFLYSTVQRSHHRWSYDSDTLARAMSRAGFVRLESIDRYGDARTPVGAWYSCGWDGYKPDA
jgi:SAM-dependent methyltransferase